MRMQRLPRTLAPKSTMPSILEISAASLGRRASKSSATRGQTAGDVLGLGGLARGLGHEGAGARSCRLRRRRCARRREWGSWPRARRARSRMTICGWRSSLCSMTTMASWPVVSSISCFMVTPSMMSMEFHLAGLFGEDRDVVGVPLDEGVAFDFCLGSGVNGGAFDAGAVGFGDDGADDDVVLFQLTAVVAENGDGAVFVEDDVVAVFELRPGGGRCSGRCRRTWR